MYNDTFKMSQFQIEIRAKKLNTLVFSTLPALLSTGLLASSLANNYWLENVIVPSNQSSIQEAQSSNFGLFKLCQESILVDTSTTSISSCTPLETVNVGLIDDRLQDDLKTLRIGLVVLCVLSVLWLLFMAYSSVEAFPQKLFLRNRTISTVVVGILLYIVQLGFLANFTVNRSQSSSPIIGGTGYSFGIGFYMAWISFIIESVTIMNLILTLYFAE